MRHAPVPAGFAKSVIQAQQTVPPGGAGPLGEPELLAPRRLVLRQVAARSESSSYHSPSYGNICQQQIAKRLPPASSSAVFCVSSPHVIVPPSPDSAPEAWMSPSYSHSAAFAALALCNPYSEVPPTRRTRGAGRTSHSSGTGHRFPWAGSVNGRAVQKSCRRIMRPLPPPCAGGTAVRHGSARTPSSPPPRAGRISGPDPSAAPR